MSALARNLGKFLLAACLCSPAAYACPACRASAASADSHSQRGLRRGVLVLLLPALGALAGMGVVIYRNREP
jgi:hypothetical protein